MSVNFHARATLGLAAADPARLSVRSQTDQSHLEGFTGHWTGFGRTLYHPDPIQRLRGIQSFHMSPGGLGTTHGAGDIAYNFAFDRDGNVYELRDAKWNGAHALSPNNNANRLTLGAVWLEDARGWGPGCNSAVEWLANLFRLTRNRKATWFDHNWWARQNGQGTECSGSDFRTVIRYVGGRV